MRLHPLAPATATAVGRSDDPRALAAAASALSHARLELQCLDVRWDDGAGRGPGALGRRRPSAGPPSTCRALLAAEGLEASVEDDDGALWDAQRERSAPTAGTVVRVSGLQDPDRRCCWSWRASWTAGGRPGRASACPG